MNTNPHGACAAASGTANSIHADTVTRAFAVIAMLGIATISVIGLAVQFLRSDLDWLTTALSIYVIGPYGDAVRASFYAPVPGILVLGIGWWRALDRRARSVFPLVLFVVAAAALGVTATFTSDSTRWPVTLHGTIHQWAAFGTFLCVTTAALLQSLRLRFDPRLRIHFIEATTIASVCVVYFWIYALVTPIPRGLGEKAVIALVLLWLWRAAWWLFSNRAGPRPQ